MGLTTFLSSTVVAGLVAALVSLRTNERNIQITNVTQERAKWRQAIREFADEILKAGRVKDNEKLKLLCAQLSLNLNPFDSEDKGIVEAASRLAAAETTESQIAEFVDRVALLLKHDWDRAKYEASPWFFQDREPDRVSYCEFKRTAPMPPKARPGIKHWIRLFYYFVGLGCSAAIMYFLVVGLNTPFHTLIKEFNDLTKEKSLSAWAEFLSWSLFYGSIWSAAYLWFKGSEKKFLDRWFSK
ncbi:hypothetical protein [Uliginosibacterium sp. TH139]|uniref:hypothetical protein n=1 Tax=Uliginosibacterium sp. TH139 TaxID=2067453 RepID=UPI000C7AC829|nr:hypothetical protein [Uliginosibacterium sp. TH139]PLK49558.1 hypothetical protein C0V76_03730 [Uliginosibacterium sp. TH139]